MQTIKLGMVLTLGLAAVYLGSIAVAWRRAIVHLGRRVLGRMLTFHTIRSVTPSFVESRERATLALFAGMTFVAWLLFTWREAAGLLVSTCAFSWLGTLIHPRPSDPYYLNQVIEDLNARIRVAEQLGD